jgi:glycosyltransferase involved in cell wall biosynthesis
VIPRPLRLNNTNFEIPQRIVELEGKTTQGSDIVIQHVLPHMMEYSGHFKKNIALFELETTSFAHNKWAEHINIMDEAWLTSGHAEQICKNSGVNIPTTTILHTTDMSKYSKTYECLDIPNDNEFTFYTIADMNNRKNISAIIRAYHTEFDPSEPVALLIKMSKYGMTPQATLDELKNHCNQLKQGLKLYPKIDYYKPEILVPNVVDDETIYRLHSSCDCFVSTSCGEAFCYPAFDAMAFGKTPIVTNWSGYTDYINDNTGWLVNSYMQQAFGGTDAFQSIYTGHESWAVVDINHLRRCMREAYEDKNLREKKSAAGKQRACDFSYEVIGPKLRKVLESYE